MAFKFVAGGEVTLQLTQLHCELHPTVIGPERTNRVGAPVQSCNDMRFSQRQQLFFTNFYIFLYGRRSVDARHSLCRPLSTDSGLVVGCSHEFKVALLLVEGSIVSNPTQACLFPFLSRFLCGLSSLSYSSSPRSRLSAAPAEPL